MRPFLPQSRFNFPVLVKLVVIYGFMTNVVLFCLVVIAFASSQFGEYWHDYKIFGMNSVIYDLKEDFGGGESQFMWAVRQSPLLTLLAPFGAGGSLGVLHYIFVRRRKSVYNIQESSKSDE